MKRFFIGFALLTVLVAIAVVGNTSSPSPLTFALALVYGGILATPPVALWYAFETRRRQR